MARPAPLYLATPRGPDQLQVFGSRLALGNVPDVGESELILELSSVAGSA